MGRLFKRPEPLLSEIELAKQLEVLIDKCNYKRAFKLALRHLSQRTQYSPQTLLLMYASLLPHDLPYAESTRNEAMTTRNDGGVDIDTKAEFHLLAARYYIEQRKLDEAHQELDKAKEQFGFLPDVTQGRIHLEESYLAIQCGDTTSAIGHFLTAEAVLFTESSSSPSVRDLTWVELLLALPTDDVDRELSGLCYNVIEWDPNPYRRRMALKLVSRFPGSKARAIHHLLPR